MEWERDVARDSLLILLISLLILTLAGAIVGWEVFRAPPEEFIGKAASGYVSLCVDDSPTLALDNWTAYVSSPFVYNVSKNITSNPNGWPIYYYIKDETVPNPDFNITWDTGIINFTPESADENVHNVTVCVTHSYCEGIEYCKSTNFTIIDYGGPIWNETVPDFETNETDIVDGNPDPIYNLDTSEYHLSINFSDYVYEPDNESMTFSAFGVSEDLSKTFSAFSLDSSTGKAEIIDPDDKDIRYFAGAVQPHRIRIRATDESNNNNFSNTFDITVLNTIDDAPIIESIPYQYICEDSLYQYQVNATDPDPDEDVDNYAADTIWSTFSINTITGLIAFTTNESDIGDHDAEVHANDEPDLTGSTDFNCTVIRINDYPKFDFNNTIPELPNTTEGRNYYFDFDAIDEEYGNESSGNLTFTCNLSWINDSMNHTTGVVNTIVPDGVGGTSNVRICVKDIGINTHPNAEAECGETGEPKETCNDTFIYIGNNTAPQITNWTPENFTVRIRELQSIKFKIIFLDLDNSSLHVYWLVDGEVSQYEIVNPNSPYPPSSYLFETNYASAGSYLVRAVVSDGGRQDSVTWNVTVVDVLEPPEEGGGGGGGGIPTPCEELWTCSQWTACQRLTESITYPLRGDILDSCADEAIPEENCGYKTRVCTEENNCGTSFKRPDEIRGCYFVQNPNCYDGVKNCHHGSCEILIDCGGPCDPCPTCSDGIMNQGEKGIDCGGPCIPCKPEKALPPECGDKVCTLNELFTCTLDCWNVWLTIIVILITLLGFKVGLKNIKKLRSKRLERDKIQNIESLAEAIEKAIESKDIVLARKLYSKSREVFKNLPAKEKLRLYPRLAKSLKKLKKYDAKKKSKK